MLPPFLLMQPVTAHRSTYAPSGAVVPFEVSSVSPLWAAASTVSAGLGAYHGYRRNNSVGWALAWAVAGAVAPVVVPAIAVAQGFGKKEGK